MKQPKKLSRMQKILVSAHKLNPDNWMLLEDGKDRITIRHKKSGKIKFIEK